MQREDAAAFIIDYAQNPRSSNGYPSYGYEIYLPNVIAAYLVEVEHSRDHHSTLRTSQRARELSPAFYDAAWHLCRHGILRPGIMRVGTQAAGEGDGYCVTELGRAWIEQGTPAFTLMASGRLGSLFQSMAARLGEGLLQRANEASRCHSFGCYVASCAMCGAAAESIVLAVAVAGTADEAAVLRNYRAAGGRRRVIDSIIAGARPAIAEPFRSATALLSYWRDEAAHGTASTISEIEAHEALARLLRFAQFVCDNWNELTNRRSQS